MVISKKITPRLAKRKLLDKIVSQLHSYGWLIATENAIDGYRASFMVVVD